MCWGTQKRKRKSKKLPDRCVEGCAGNRGLGGVVGEHGIGKKRGKNAYMVTVAPRFKNKRKNIQTERFCRVAGMSSTKRTFLNEISKSIAISKVAALAVTPETPLHSLAFSVILRDFSCYPPFFFTLRNRPSLCHLCSASHVAPSGPIRPFAGPDLNFWPALHIRRNFLVAACPAGKTLFALQSAEDNVPRVYGKLQGYRKNPSSCGTVIVTDNINLIHLGHSWRGYQEEK